MVWRRKGRETVSGVNVPSKTFGELVEHARHTPRVTAEALESMRRLQPFDRRRRQGVDISRAMRMPTLIGCHSRMVVGKVTVTGLTPPAQEREPT